MTELECLGLVMVGVCRLCGKGVYCRVDWMGGQQFSHGGKEFIVKSSKGALHGCLVFE